MEMFQLLVIVLFLLLLMLSGKFCDEVTDTPPFTVWDKEHDNNQFMITLTCMRPGDGFKDNVKTAFFYRNGVMEGSADPCLQGTSRPNGYFNLYLTPECEGYFMCAISKQEKDGWQYEILSSPRPLYARPMKVCTSCQTVDVDGHMGANVTLQSSFRIHALNSVEVRWFKIVDNSHQLITEGINPKDYSLTLTDLSWEHAAKYYATVISKEHTEWKLNGSIITLNVQDEGSHFIMVGVIFMVVVIFMVAALLGLAVVVPYLCKNCEVHPQPRCDDVLQLREALKNVIIELRQRPNVDVKLKNLLEYLQRVLFNRPVTQSLFMTQVASQMLDKWQDFGMMLEIPAADISAIRADCPHHSDQCFIRVIQEWQSSCKKPFTWCTVLQILESPAIDERNLAKKLAEKLLEEEGKKNT